MNYLSIYHILQTITITISKDEEVNGLLEDNLNPFLESLET